MPDDTWNTERPDIPLRRAVEIFIPNVCAIDMDTTGTWPFGRRPEDQVATRFLSIFLDMKSGCGGKPCNLESLSDQALWDHAPIEPKTPPNPLKNDKEFLARIPLSGGALVMGALVRMPVRTLVLLLACCLPTAGRAAEPTDYEAELAKIRRQLAPLEGVAFQEPVDLEKVSKYAFLKYRYSSLTADFADFRAAETALDEAIRKVAPRKTSSCSRPTSISSSTGWRGRKRTCGRCRTSPTVPR